MSRDVCAKPGCGRGRRWHGDGALAADECDHLFVEPHPEVGEKARIPACYLERDDSGSSAQAFGAGYTAGRDAALKKCEALARMPHWDTDEAIADAIAALARDR